MDIRNLNAADLPAVFELCGRTLVLDTFTPEVLRRRLLGVPRDAWRGAFGG